MNLSLPEPDSRDELLFKNKSAYVSRQYFVRSFVNLLLISLELGAENPHFANAVFTAVTMNPDGSDQVLVFFMPVIF